MNTKELRALLEIVNEYGVDEVSGPAGRACAKLLNALPDLLDEVDRLQPIGALCPLDDYREQRDRADKAEAEIHRLRERVKSAISTWEMLDGPGTPLGPFAEMDKALRAILSDDQPATEEPSPDRQMAERIAEHLYVNYEELGRMDAIQLRDAILEAMKEE